MWPGFARPVWRRRHLVFEPSFGVIQKPGLVGMYRPHWRAPNVDGLYFASVRAVLGLSPFSAGPPIWTAAHGPRMLELTGRKADGWLPTKMTPGQYQASLKTIGAAAREAGRDPGAITPAMLGYVLLGPDEETVQRLTEQPLVRALCVLLPAAVFRELGVEPPLAAGGRGAYPRMLAGYAEHEDTPVRRLKDGSTVVVEVSFTGRTTAGRPVVFDAVRRVRPGRRADQAAVHLVRHRGRATAGGRWLRRWA